MAFDRAMLLFFNNGGKRLRVFTQHISQKVHASLVLIGSSIDLSRFKGSVINGTRTCASASRHEYISLPYTSISAISPFFRVYGPYLLHDTADI